MNICQRCGQWSVNFFCLCIKAYQKTISPDHGLWRKPYGHCRFYPTCSEYTLQALQKHGIGAGGWYALKRFIKCNPFHSPGHDPVP